MTTTANMSLVLPTPGGDSGTWDDLLNAALTLVDAHDHTTGKGPRVPTTGININADLTMASNALTNIGSLGFAEITALASGSRRLFFSSADHELYVRTNGGTNVKITNGAALNISIVGGIVGDYASVGAEAAYNDANDRYTWKQETGAGAVKQWATMASGHVDIYEQLATASATTISNRVRLASPAALAASYAMTFPAALPGSTQLLQVSSAGAITASNTVANAVTLSGGISGDTTVTGMLTLSSGSDMVLQGSGDYKFGSRNRHFSVPNYFNSVASWSGTSAYVVSAGSAAVAWCIPVQPGYVITALQLDVYGASSGSCDINFAREDASGAVTLQTDTHTPTNGAWTTRSYNISDTSITTGGYECISVYVTLAATGMLCRRLIITEHNPHV